MSQTGGCGCGCGGHGKQSEQDERAAAPAVAQPLGEGYRPEPVQASPEAVDAVAIAAAVTTALGGSAGRHPRAQGRQPTGSARHLRPGLNRWRLRLRRPLNPARHTLRRWRASVTVTRRAGASVSR